MSPESARLLLRPLREDDLSALAEVLGDPEVMRYIEAPFSRSATAEFIRRQAAKAEPDVLAVVRKGDGRCIGHLIWHPWDDAGAYELGWILRRDCWGRGYASELTEALLAYARQEEIPAVILESVPEQAATCRIAEKYGFRCAGSAGGLALYRLEIKKTQRKSE